MQAFILDALSHQDNFQQLLRKELINTLENKGHQHTHAELEYFDFKPCRGCFGCWTHEPGQCVFKDGVQDFTRKMINCDLVVQISPISFGGYSYHLKKVLDRSISLISPLFTTIGGETHHKKRYEKYPSLASIGICHETDSEIIDIYSTLVTRHSINLHSPQAEALIIDMQTTETLIRDKLNDFFSKFGDKE
jgi:multimeric flavodoxin WrbA